MPFLGSVSQTVWLGGFLLIECGAVGCAIAALRNVNPEYPRAFWIALSRVMASADVFTPRGWRYRIRAFQLQGVAIAWLFIAGPLIGV